VFCNIHGEIPSALALEKEVHCVRRNFLGMQGSEVGDPGPVRGYLVMGNELRPPLLRFRVTAG